LNLVFKSAQGMARAFIAQVLAVASDKDISFVKSRAFNATIVEAYIESVLIIDATLQNREMQEILAYIYNNPVKSHPLVTLIQEKTFNAADTNKSFIGKSHPSLKSQDMLQRLETAKNYLQRPALLERMNCLEDKSTSHKKIKI